MTFIFTVSGQGHATVQVFATNPSNRRIAGILLQLDAGGYSEFKGLVEYTRDMISQFKASGRISRTFVSALREGSIEIEVGAINKMVGALKFSLVIQTDQSAFLQIYAYDPSNLRKTGVVLLLEEQGFNELRNLIAKIEDIIKQTRPFTEPRGDSSPIGLQSDGPHTQYFGSIQSVPNRDPSNNSFRIVCPRCEAQDLYNAPATQNFHNFSCPRCSALFQCNIVKIRSKNSRGDKKGFRRSFSIRVYDATHHEQLIEFVNTGYDDFELRARDEAIFIYQNNTLKIVQNLTVGRYMKVSAPHCYVATYLYGATSSQVAMLREFRDMYLLNSFVGTRVVQAYYYISQVAISKFGESLLFRALCLLAILPLLLIIKSIVRGRSAKALRS